MLTPNQPIRGGNGLAGGSSRRKDKAPEPAKFAGERNAKVLDSFIFNLERYLKSTDTRLEDEKVDTAIDYLTGDAAQWWRGPLVEIQAGRVAIDTKNPCCFFPLAVNNLIPSTTG